jgi:predicted lipoprotein
MNSPKYLPFLRYSVAALVVVFIWGCNPEDKGPTGTNNNTDTTAFDQATADVLCDLSHNVILPIVTEFDAKASDLSATITALNSNHSAENLEAARTAWRAARRPWEACEGFLFGPAKNQQLDPAVDSWPLDIITMDSVLASTDQLTAAYFDNAEGSIKGSHAIEYILWGDKGDKTVDQITPREYEYLTAVTESFRGATTRLKKAWVPADQGGDDYASQLCNAGKAGSIYVSQKAGVAEVVTALYSIMTEVSDAKMGIPFQQMNNEFEEARFSGNSIPDFLANISGVEAIYEGSYGSNSGKGISDLVKAKNPDLDAKIRTQIQTAIQRVNEITPSFGEAVKAGGNRNSIQTARTAITELATSFKKDVIELLQLQ